jgi:hypothetical protein
MIAPKRLGVTGKYIDLNKLEPNDVDIRDIDRALNYIYRFTGHWKDKPPLTVAQHTWLTMEIASDLFPDEPIVKFDCLLHDMPEAYYGDIATPMKKVLKNAYREFVGHVDSVVYDVLWTVNLPFTPEVESKRKVCDLLALDIERRSMWNAVTPKKYWPEIPSERFYSNEEKAQLFTWAQQNRIIELETMYNELVGEVNDYYTE